MLAVGALHAVCDAHGESATDASKSPKHTVEGGFILFGKLHWMKRVGEV